ncbi:MAG: iron-sulfur cluster assembly scaffold protein [Candidatus Odinarchaeota archaeon]|nr:iron-sulfur cluster assembly scaffold protein [Candidatus Odinarchaeota archaeon]
MSSRIPLPYSPKILELFRNPKNLGAMEDASITARAGSPACGDLITIYLKVERVNNEDIIVKATFESYGCAANIAAASILTEIIKGKSLREAWNIKWKEVSDALGGLPAIKYHCSILAVGALKRAIRAYYGKVKEKPDWLPDELTLDEKQVWEEEKMIEKFYGIRGNQADEKK